MKLNPEYRREAYHNYIIFYDEIKRNTKDHSTVFIDTSKKSTSEKSTQDQKSISKENQNTGLFNDELTIIKLNNSNQKLNVKCDDKEIDWNQVEKACIQSGDNLKDENNQEQVNKNPDNKDTDYKEQVSNPEQLSLNHREEPYELKMLLHNSLSNILKLSITYVNDRVKYSYDITAKQTLYDWTEKKKLNKHDCESVFKSIFQVVSVCNNYLLDCNHLILQPEYVYYDISTLEYHYLYYINYSKDIMIQINELTEYIMDKIDYEDEQAVLLAYGMYHESRKTEISVISLSDYFNNKVNDIDLNRVEKVNSFHSNLDDRNIEKNDTKQLVTRPVMEVKKEEEKFTLGYPIRNYLLLGVTIVVTVFLLIIVFMQKLNKEKSIAGVLIIVSLMTYIVSRLFSNTNKIEKIIPVIKYEKPNQSVDTQPINGHRDDVEYKQNNIKISSLQYSNPDLQCNFTNTRHNEISNYHENENHSNSVYHGEENSIRNSMSNDKLNIKDIVRIEEDKRKQERYESVSKDASSEEYTQILSRTEVDDVEKECIYLEPEDRKQYDTIYIRAFPFFIGKMMDGTDATINDVAISRVHAKFSQEDEAVYITDLGSTNGTFVNGVTIQPHTMTQVQENDRVCFANITYYIRSNIGA